MVRDAFLAPPFGRKLSHNTTMSRWVATCMYTCWRGEGGKGGGQGFGSSPGLMAMKWGEPGERSNQGWRHQTETGWESLASSLFQKFKNVSFWLWTTIYSPVCKNECTLYVSWGQTGKLMKVEDAKIFQWKLKFWNVWWIRWRFFQQVPPAWC